MLSLREREIREILDEDQKYNRVRFENEKKNAAINNITYSPPKKFEKAVAFEMNKYFIKIQAAIDKAINDSTEKNFIDIVEAYRLTVEYIDAYANKRGLVQRDISKIEDKFDSISNSINHVVDLCRDANFLFTLNKLEHIKNNIDERIYSYTDFETKPRDFLSTGAPVELSNNLRIPVSKARLYNDYTFDNESWTSARSEILLDDYSVSDSGESDEDKSEVGSTYSNTSRLSPSTTSSRVNFPRSDEGSAFDIYSRKRLERLEREAQQEEREEREEALEKAQALTQARAYDKEAQQEEREEREEALEKAQALTQARAYEKEQARVYEKEAQQEKREREIENAETQAYAREKKAQEYKREEALRREEQIKRTQEYKREEALRREEQIKRAQEYEREEALKKEAQIKRTQEYEREEALKKEAQIERIQAYEQRIALEKKAQIKRTEVYELTIALEKAIEQKNQADQKIEKAPTLKEKQEALVEKKAAIKKIDDLYLKERKAKSEKSIAERELLVAQRQLKEREKTEEAIAEREEAIAEREKKDLDKPSILSPTDMYIQLKILDKPNNPYSIPLVSQAEFEKTENSHERNGYMALRHLGANVKKVTNANNKDVYTSYKYINKDGKNVNVTKNTYTKALKYVKTNPEERKALEETKKQPLTNTQELLQTAPPVPVKTPIGQGLPRCFQPRSYTSYENTSKKKKNMLGGISNAEDEDMGLPFGIRKAITLRKVDRKPLNMHMFNADNEVSLEDRMYFLNQLDEVPIKELEEDNINSVKNLYKSMERKLKKLK